MEEEIKKLITKYREQKELHMRTYKAYLYFTDDERKSGLACAKVLSSVIVDLEELLQGGKG